MNEILKVVLSLSASASLLIVLLLALRPLYRRRLHKSWQYYIWLVVVVRLLLPFAPEINLMDTVLHRVHIPGMETVLESGQGLPVLSAEPEALQPEAEPLQASPLEQLGENIWLGWLLVALVQLVRKVTGYRNFVRFIKAGRQRVTDDALLETYQRALEDAGIRRAPELYRNKLAVSPMLVGILQPFIVLPDTSLAPEAMGLVLRHELTHLRRWDILYKWLVQLTLCLHWFNPLVYSMAREIDKTCELSCDEWVLRALDTDEKRQYGNTLLAAVGSGGSYGDTVASLTLNEDARLLKERLEAILYYGKKPVVVAVASGVFALTLFCIAAVAGAYTGINSRLPHSAPAETEKPYQYGVPVVPDIPDIAVATEALSVTSDRYEYQSRGSSVSYSFQYFQNQYILNFRWEKNHGPAGYPASIKRTVDGIVYTVALTDKTQAYKEVTAVQSALDQSISRMAARVERDTGSRDSWSNSVIVLQEVKGPYSETANQLLNRFYREDNTADFLAVLPSGSQSTLEALLHQAYDEDRESYLLFILGQLKDYNADALAERAMAEGKTHALLFLTDHISDQMREKLLAKATEQELPAVASRLYDGSDSGSTDTASLAESAYRSGSVAMFSLFCDDLDTATQKKYAARSYEDGRVAFFSLLVDQLSKSEREVFLKRAVADGNVAFASILVE